jgi:adenine-specific DNA-methyltransferase
MATNNKRSVEAFKHDDAKRKNIPSAEQQSFVDKDHQEVKKVRYPRNTDLDPQLMWRGKDEQDWSDLVVNAPPLYIQEKVHPKALVDELLRQSRESEHEAGQSTADLFSDFNGIPKDADKTEFYTHDQNWTNRMILGDSLQVMASLAEREGLRGKVQCVYFDPPYGIKFNSNFQWSTTSRDVKDGRADHITREPEQVKAFRDTWRDGIHSYLTYLRDRLTVARDLLGQTGSIFVQISDENLHTLRSVLDEVFGPENFAALITFRKTSITFATGRLGGVSDYILWYAKDITAYKYRPAFRMKQMGGDGASNYGFVELNTGETRRLLADEKEATSKLPVNSRIFSTENLMSSGATPSCIFDFQLNGEIYPPVKGKSWKTHKDGMSRLAASGRLIPLGDKRLYYKTYFDEYPITKLTNLWDDTRGEMDLRYVVQTSELIVQRCMLMCTDPGDLVLDPTCGSGTTAAVAEQWGRRWITLDTSRVSLALARARIMGARYPFYLLADSREGQLKEAEITRTAPSSQNVQGNIAHGFVYGRVPHVTLGAIANNTEIDVIADKWQTLLDSVRAKINVALKNSWQEWEIPREAEENWPDTAKKLHSEWWQARTERQQEIDKSIATKAEFEYLYDKPYEDKKKVRVAGPFTVESLSPHRTLGVDENDELIDFSTMSKGEYSAKQSFEQMVLQNLEAAGVQQAHKENRINFTSLVPWPGTLVCAEGQYFEGDEQNGKERRAAVFIGPEFGTVQRADLVAAAREAAEAGFDALIACAFNYEAHATEFTKLGSIPVLKARMNADLHMAEDLKNNGKGNLFVIFGEPDIAILDEPDGRIRVKVNGVDVFKPQTGEVISDGADGIACWFIDTDYNEESFFVRHAYFLGANDPYSALKSTLKAEINEDAWATLNSDTSRAFNKPKNGRFAVKVINHLGDEVMKVFKV